MEVCSQKSNEQYSIIVPNSGLAPARRQAIIWTNASQFTDAYIRHSGWERLFCVKSNQNQFIQHGAVITRSIFSKIFATPLLAR